MLIRFSVENVLCFAAEATFSMIASVDTSHANHVSPGETAAQPALLRATALYGANGHGKTNFVEAIRLLREIVMNNGDGGVPKSFKLSSQYTDRPSRFSIEFRVDDEDYEYGIVVAKTHISEEWLFVKPPQGRERKIFERATKMSNKDDFVSSASFGAAVRRGKYKDGKHSIGTVLDVISESVPPNQTLLNEAHSRDIAEIKKAFSWFRKTLTPVAATSSYQPLFERAKSDKGFIKHLSDFLKYADVGIASIQFRETPVEAASLPDDIRAEAEILEQNETLVAGGLEGAEIAISRDKKGKLVASRLVSLRKGDRDKAIGFEIAEESAGTRRLFDLLPMTMSEPGASRVYIVDELDRKLHPLLARTLIETFFLKGSGQLIFTTHNTLLMDLALLRSDEIWFVQKKKDGSSEFYSLSDLKITQDLDVRKGYLNGRFGGIPFLGDIEALGWAKK